MGQFSAKVTSLKSAYLKSSIVILITRTLMNEEDRDGKVMRVRSRTKVREQNPEPIKSANSDKIYGVIERGTV